MRSALASGTPALHELQTEAGSFRALLQAPLGCPRGWVIFVHGLGECRSGTNYLLRELSDELIDHGWVTVRFDLGGLGDSELPLDYDVWRKQLAAVCGLVPDNEVLHLLGRGSGCCLLDEVAASGTKIALRPPLPRDLEAIERLRPDEDGWLRPLGGESQSGLWEGLGVEIPLIGGLEVPLSLLQRLSPASSGQNLILPACEADEVPYATPIEDADRLFMSRDARLALRALIPRLV